MKYLPLVVPKKMVPTTKSRAEKKELCQKKGRAEKKGPKEKGRAEKKKSCQKKSRAEK